jgi:hypothetical protein
MSAASVSVSHSSFAAGRVAVMAVRCREQGEL